LSNPEGGDELQLIRNELKRIKSDTNNINRIITIANSDVVIQELKKAVGVSKIRAAILMLTKDNVSAKDLAAKLGIDPANLGRDMKELAGGNREFVTVTEVGKQRFFQRAQLVDLIGFEKIPEIANLLKQWEEDRARQTQAPLPEGSQARVEAPPQAQTNVS
jgi:DNA-binding MarR family transcriptional regulator